MAERRYSMAWSSLSSLEIPTKSEVQEVLGLGSIIDYANYDSSYYKYYGFKVKISSIILVSMSIHVLRSQFPGHKTKTIGTIPYNFSPTFTTASCVFDDQGGASNAGRMLHLTFNGIIVISGDPNGDYYSGDYASATFIYKRNS